MPKARNIGRYGSVICRGVVERWALPCFARVANPSAEPTDRTRTDWRTLPYPYAPDASMGVSRYRQRYIVPENHARADAQGRQNSAPLHSNENFSQITKHLTCIIKLWYYRI